MHELWTQFWPDAREEFILRGVLFANLLELLVPGGSTIVGFLPEPSDHVLVLIRVNHHMVSLSQSVRNEEETKKWGRVFVDEFIWTLVCSSDSHTYVALIPFGQIKLVGEEIPHASLLHFLLQHLQEVSKPFEGMRFPAQPIEVDLEPGSRRGRDEQWSLLLKETCHAASECSGLIVNMCALFSIEKTTPTPVWHSSGAAVCQCGEKDMQVSLPKNTKSPANRVIPSWFAVWGWIPWTCTRWTWGWRRRGWLRCQRRPACWPHSRRRPRWLCQMGRPRPSWWKYR